jgi:hypothetical protein
VAAHPFYRAQQVQKNFGTMTAPLAAAKNDKLVKDQVIHLAEALSQFRDLGDALDAYFDFDARRRNPVVKKDAQQTFYFHLASLNLSVLEALKCGVSQLREPN